MSAYKELELAETERDEYEAREAIKWECRQDAVEEREASSSMTYEEAIDKIVWTPLMRSPNENGELKEALYMACNALEKQIPKKPLHSGFNYDCPTCLDNVGMLTIRGRVIKHHHCRCGQAIDWSEE